MRQALLSAALLCLASHASSQLGNPPGGPSVSPPPKIWVGDGVNSFGTYSGQNESPFVDALLAYGGTIREIEVLPGTYVFGSTIDLDRAGMRLYGSAGAVIKTRSSLSGELFRVLAEDVALDGLTFCETRPTEEGLVRVEAGGVAIVGCTFDLQSPDATGDIAALEMVGSAGAPLDAALVRNCQFLFSAPNANQAGHSGLRASWCRALRIFGNRFAAKVLSPTPPVVRRAFELEECAWSVVAGNVIHSISGATTAASDSLLDLHATGAAAGVVSGNYFEMVSGAAILSLDGALGRYAVNGNGLGRTQAPLGHVHVAKTQGTVIVGNQLHRQLSPEGESYRSIQVDQAACDVLVSDNTFGLAISLQLDFADTVGVTCVGNRFERGGTIPPAALDLGNTTHTLVVGNLSNSFGQFHIGRDPDMGDATNKNTP